MTTKKEEALAVKEKAGGGALATYDYGNSAGVGYENQTAADTLIPFLAILQDLSPQVKKKDATYIEGAEPGMLLNTGSQQLFKGDEGVIFVPVLTENVFVEWIPRDKGGGFVDVHPIDGEVVAEARKRCKFGEYTTKDGNELGETFYLYGMRLDSPDQTDPGEPMIIACTSTKIKVYKQLMYRLRSFVISAGGRKIKPPLFAHRILIRTKDEKNKAGQPYVNFEFRALIENDVAKSLIPPKVGDQPNPLLVAAQALHDGIMAGRLRANYEQQGAANSSEGGGETKVPF